MKRIVIFIGLKVAELIGVGLGYLLLSGFGYFLMNLEPDETNPECWYSILYALIGLMCVVTIGLVLIILYFVITELIPNWLESNWNWAGRLSSKRKY